MSSTFHQDYFFTACGGHLRHFTPWGDTATEDWGYPSGVPLNKDNQNVRGPGAVAYGRGRALQHRLRCRLLGWGR